MPLTLTLTLLAACGPGGHPTALVGEASSEVDEHMGSIVRVDWTLERRADAVWVDYRAVGDEEWISTPIEDGDAGRHSTLLLGLPYETAVEWRVAGTAGGETFATEVSHDFTRYPPEGMPEVTLEVDGEWDPAGRFLLTSLSDCDASADPDVAFWVAILDRAGRIVWSLPVEGDGTANPWTLFVRPSFDGRAILYDEDYFWTGFGGEEVGHVRRVGIDGVEQQAWETPNLHHSFDDLGDGVIAWMDSTENDDRLWIRDGDAEPVEVWDCFEWLEEDHGPGGMPSGRDLGTYCGSNALFWNEDRDSFLISLFSNGAVLEVARETGETMWEASPGRGWGYTILPTGTGWTWQHEAHYVAPDRILLTSGVRGERGQMFVATAAREFAVDHDAHELNLVWEYQSDDEWVARYKGGARRLPGGNTLVYYGSFGGAREVTPEGEIVWQVRLGGGGWMGRSWFVDDLYAFAP